jgi:hypothetical protein
MFKKILIITIIAASLQLFRFSFLPDSVMKIIGLAGVVIILLTIGLQLVYSPVEHFVLNFKWEILLIFIAVFTSMFMANYNYNQGFGTTLIAQRFMYYYLTYYMLHLLKIPDYDLEKIIIGFAVVHSIFYLIQFAAFPVRIFDVRAAESRGTIRIFLPGLAYLVIAYFLLLNQIFKRFSLSKLAMLLLFVSIFFLMATRQLILSVLLISLINVLFSKQVKSKILIIVLIVLGTIPLIIMFQDLILSMVTLSQKQTENIEDDIRVSAAIFYLTDFFPNKWGYLFGNGMDSTNSSYGVIVQMYRSVYHFIQSDIGIIGDFSRFGLIFLTGVVLMLVKVLKEKMTGKLNYIKYFFVFVILVSFTGDGFFGNSAGHIVAISLLLYIIDVNHFRDQTQTLEANPDVDKESEINTH